MIHLVLALVVASITCMVLSLPSLPEGRIPRALAMDRLLKVRQKYLTEVAGYRHFLGLLTLLGGEVGLSEKGASELEQKLEVASYPLGLTPGEFQALRTLAGIIGFALGVILGLVAFDPISALLIGAACAFIWAYIPGAWLDGMLADSRGQLGRDIPYVIDLITLTMEAGANFLQALQEAVFCLRGETVTAELVTMLQELQMGVSREEAMRNLAGRVRLDWFTSFVNTIIAAENFGVPMAQALREQAELLRTERAQRAGKLAEEAPTKLVFPSVLQMLTIIFLMGGIFWMKQIAGDYSAGTP